VDKVVNKCLLTAENAFTGAGFNKMPNPQAEFILNKIKDLAKRKKSWPGLSGPLEKYFFVHK
jgi:hypothetical protein